MEEKQINRQLRRQFRPIGWGLLAYYGILNVLVILAMVVDMVAWIGKHPWETVFTGMDPGSLLDNGWGYLLAIGTGWVILHAWKGGGYRYRNVYAKTAPMTGKTALALLSLILGAQMVNGLWVQLLEGILNLFDRSLLEQMEGVSGASGTISMFLYSTVAAPIWEEVLFRGYVLHTLKPYGKRFAVFASAFLFGMFHGNLMQTPYAFLVGLVLGYTAVEYSIFWAIGLHMFNNLVLADLISRLLELLPIPVGNLLYLVLFGGGLLAALGILISRRDRIREYCRRDWIDRRCLKCFFTNSGTAAFILVMVLCMLSTLAAT